MRKNQRVFALLVFLLFLMVVSVILLKENLFSLQVVKKETFVQKNNQENSNGSLKKGDFPLYSPSSISIKKNSPGLGMEQYKKTALKKVSQMQMPFIANQGQVANKNVCFYVKTLGGTLFVTREGEMVYSLPAEGEKKDLARSKSPVEEPKIGPVKKEEKNSPKGWTLKETLVAAQRAEPKGINKAETKINYFIGTDQTLWKNDIATYESVNWGEVYPGIEFSLKASGKNVEKIFTVQPGVDYQAIRLKMEGAKSIRVNDQGELEIETGLGVVRFTSPLAYQEKKGQKEYVQVAYYVEKDNYGFTVRDYDKSYPLIIDPLLASTFMGGSFSEGAYGIALDDLGNVYVTGITSSVDYPTTPGAYNTTYNNVHDIFVSKLNPNLSTLLASTFIGGSDDDYSTSLVINNSGHVYVTGRTWSADYPTTPGAYNTTYYSSVDAFVSKLDANLSTLLASTYIGGGSDQAWALALDSLGNVYVAGDTYSSSYPITPGAYDRTHNGAYDVFVSKLDANLSTLLASTFIGGAGTDCATSLFIDSLGYVYVAGYTESVSFPYYPTTANAYDTTFNGNVDVFVSKLDSDLSRLLASTFLGGSGVDRANSLALDNSGNVYVAGITSSTDYPTTPRAYDKTYNGGIYDVFVSKLDTDLSNLLASTFLGGNNVDGHDPAGTDAVLLSLDNLGNVYAAGLTYSADYPTTAGAYNPTYNTGSGEGDVFISKLDADLNNLLASTFLGGSSWDCPLALTLNRSGNVYVAGTTNSTDFPLTPGAYGMTPNGYEDVFVSMFTGDLSGVPNISISPPSYNFGSISAGSSSAPQTFTVTNTGNGTLVMGAITLTGTDPSQFNIRHDRVSGKNIAPGANKTVQVVFSPTSGGSKSATLSFPSNDPDTPELTVNLYGTGVVYTMSGKITLWGIGLSGVTVNLTGTSWATTTTNANGDYIFTGLSNGGYTITPSLAGYTFTPLFISITISDANVTGQNFTATPISTHTISGKITRWVYGFSGVTVILTGTVSAATTTNLYGKYTFTNIPYGSYTINPCKKGFMFSPASRNVIIAGADVTGQDFAAKSASYTIFGKVTKADGKAFSGVTITLVDGGCTHTTTTNFYGNYSFRVPDGTFTLTPSKTGYSFSPTSQTIVVSGANQTRINFSQTPP